MMKKLVSLYTVLLTLPAAAQFAPQAGVAGTTAIHNGDNRFVGWASHCTLQRGWKDVADKSQGTATIGSEADAVGKANKSIVSLGDSGIAMLTFDAPLYNGAGPDFAVFENGFANPADPEEAFLELAFVEVSSDGVNFFRFNAESQTESPQIPEAGVYMNARKIHNLAGKYIVNYGTPFDLEELKDEPGLDVNNITHIRLVDVIGSIGSNGSKDKNGNVINDPYPTVLPSSGFDLDAVGALYMKGRWPSGIANTQFAAEVQLYPNPATDVLNVRADNFSAITAHVADVTGRVVLQSANSAGLQQLDVSHISAGVYYLTLTGENGNQWTGRFTKH